MEEIAIDKNILSGYKIPAPHIEISYNIGPHSSILESIQSESRFFRGSDYISEIIREVEELIYDMNDCLRIYGETLDRKVIDGNKFLWGKAYGFRTDNISQVYSYQRGVNESGWCLRFGIGLANYYCREVDGDIIGVGVNSRDRLGEYNNLKRLQDSLSHFKKDMEDRFPGYW